MNNCTCTFNIIYRIGGDTKLNDNICNVDKKLEKNKKIKVKNSLNNTKI